jgi:hypothetical protein
MVRSSIELAQLICIKILNQTMKYDLTVIRWHKAIIADPEKKLGRSLKSYEKNL